MSHYFPATDQEPGRTCTLLADPDGSVVRRTVLPTGLRVITEQVPGVRSATMGVWAGVGSRDETPAEAGAAHFLEHLLFKGTQARSALDIAASIDAVGGELNAFTSKEFTCFYAKVLGRDLPLAIEVLLDVTTRPALSTPDIDAERQVVLEEISMHEDDATDRSYELLQAGLLSPSRLSLPILGTRQGIADVDPQIIREFFAYHYRPENLVVAVAGDVDHESVVSGVSQATESLGWQQDLPPNPLSDYGDAPGVFPAGLDFTGWPGEQCTVTLGTMGLPHAHDDRRSLDVFNTLLGGGMSSRLFQSIREERGLAYSVYSFHMPFSDTGIWGLSAGCSPDRAVDVLTVAQSELDKVARDGVTPAEVDRAKGHLSGALVLAGEETAARMTALGRAEVSTGQLFSLDEALARVAAVDTRKVMRVAHRLLEQPRRVAVVGPTAEDETVRAQLTELAVATSPSGATGEGT